MNRLLHNSKVLWVVSIVVAILLWMYVVTDQNPMTFDNINDIPVDVLNVETLEEKGLIISEVQDYTVDIRVYGRRNHLYSLNKSNIKAYIDVSQLNNKGTHYLPIVISGIPSEVELSRKDPDAIQITLDAIVNQPRDINVTITGSPLGDMAALPYELSQSTAHLDGPEDILNQVDQVVGSIEITDANEDIHRSLPLIALDSDGEEVVGVSIMPESVDITIPIRPTKRVPITPDIIGELPEGYEMLNVSTNPATVRIAANQEDLNEIDGIQTEEININEETQSFEREVELIVPQGALLIDTGTTLTLTATIEEYIQEEFQISDINVTNLDQALILEEDIINEPITITVSGLQNQIASLDPKKISLTIDASDLGEGEHEVVLQINLPEGITLENIFPDRVTIKIKGKESQNQDQETQEEEEKDNGR